MTDTEQTKTDLMISNILKTHTYIYDGFNYYNDVDDIEYDSDYLKKEVKLIYINLNILNSFILSNQISVSDLKKYEQYMNYLSYIYLLIENKLKNKDTSSYLEFIRNKYVKLNYNLNDNELNVIVNKQKEEERKAKEEEERKAKEEEERKAKKEEERKAKKEEERKAKEEEEEEEEARKAKEEELSKQGAPTPVILPVPVPVPAPGAPVPAPGAPAPVPVIPAPVPVIPAPGAPEPVIPVISKLRNFVEKIKTTETNYSCVNEITSIISEINQIENSGEKLSEEQKRTIEDLIKTFYENIFCEYLLKFKDFINSKITNTLNIITNDEINKYETQFCLNKNLINEIIKFLNIKDQNKLQEFDKLIKILKSLKNIIDIVYNKKNNDSMKQKINELFNELLSNITNCHEFNKKQLIVIITNINTLSINIDDLKKQLDNEEYIIEELKNTANFDIGSYTINETTIDSIEQKINLVVNALNGQLYDNILHLAKESHLSICAKIHEYLDNLYMNILKIYIKLLPQIFEKFYSTYIATTEIFLTYHLRVFINKIKYCLDKISKKENNGRFFSSPCFNKEIKQEYMQSFENISNIVEQIYGILAIIKTIKNIKITDNLFKNITISFLTMLKEYENYDFSNAIDFSGEKGRLEEIITKLDFIPTLEQQFSVKTIYKNSDSNQNFYGIVFYYNNEPIFCHSLSNEEQYSCFLNCPHFNKEVNNKFDVRNFTINELEQFLGINENQSPAPAHPEYTDVEYYISDRNRLNIDGVNFFKITSDHREIKILLKKENNEFEEVIFTCNLQDCTNNANPPNYTNPQYTTNEEFFKNLLKINLINIHKLFSYQVLVYLSYNYNNFKIFNYDQFLQKSTGLSSYSPPTTTGSRTTHYPYTPTYRSPPSYHVVTGSPTTTTTYPAYYSALPSATTTTYSPRFGGQNNDDNNKDQETYINKIIIKIFNKLMISSENEMMIFFKEFEKFKEFYL